MSNRKALSTVETESRITNAEPADELGGLRTDDLSCASSPRLVLSVTSNVSADHSAGMPDGGSGHAAASDSGPAWAASITDLLRYSVRLMKWRDRHSVRRCCKCQREGNSDQLDHFFAPISSAKTRSFARPHATPCT